jgi:hypothetical protein
MRTIIEIAKAIIEDIRTDLFYRFGIGGEEMSQEMKNFIYLGENKITNWPEDFPEEQ